MKFNQLLFVLFAPGIASSSNFRGSEGVNQAHEDIERDLGSCDYQCPPNSHRKPDRKCYNNFFDCECDYGYFEKNYQCYKYDNDDKCDYKCPPYSHPKDNRKCYDNFHDCECDPGYKKHDYSDKCEKDDYGGSDPGYPDKVVTLKVTNLSFQQPFSAFFVATHNEYAPPLWVFGEKASEELALLAENGDPKPLVKKYSGLKDVGDAFVFDKGAPYFGGESFTVDIPIYPKFPYVSVASMAINTNDCFVSINGVPLKPGDVFTGVGYDAGSEENNENCNSIPGPACEKIDQGNRRDGNGEGFVHVHRGFHGVGKFLTAKGYDWRNPMVRWEVLK